MWKIPVISRDPGPPQRGDDLCDLRSLPVFYMGEWARLGLLVDRVEEALGVLEANGYPVEAGTGDQPARIELSRIEDLRDVIGLLEKNAIAVESGDVIDGIYRG